MPPSIGDIPRLSLNDLGDQVDAGSAAAFRQQLGVQPPQVHTDQANEAAFLARQEGPETRSRSLQQPAPAVYFGPHAPGQVRQVTQAGQQIRDRAMFSPNLGATLLPPQEHDLVGNWRDVGVADQRPRPPSYEALSDYRNAHLFDARQSLPRQHQATQEFGGRLDQLQADQQSGRLTDNEFRQRAEALQTDLENAHRGTDPEDARQGERVYDSGAISDHVHAVAMTDLGVQVHHGPTLESVLDNNGLIRVSNVQLANYRAAVDVVQAGAHGGDINAAVDRAVHDYNLAPQAADGPDGQSGLRRMGRQSAAGGLARADEFDLLEARLAVQEGNDPEQVGARGNFIHPDDIAELQGVANEGLRGTPVQRLDAENNIRFQSASLDQAAQRQGMVRADGTIHPEDRAHLQAVVDEVAATGGSRGSLTQRTAAEANIRFEDATLEHAAQERNMVRPDGTIHPDDRAHLQAVVDEVAATGGSRSYPFQLAGAEDDIRVGDVTLEQAAQQNEIVRSTGTIHSEDRARLQAVVDEVTFRETPRTDQ